LPYLDINNDWDTGPVYIYDNNGNLLHSVAPGSGGYNQPIDGRADPFGNMWVLNWNRTLSKFDTNGNPLSPSAGFAFPNSLPLGFAYNAGSVDISFISVDPSGDVWGPGSGSSSGCFNEVSNSGASITPSGNFCGSAGNSVIWNTATDGAGDAWFLGNNSISKTSSAGALLASGVNTNGCFAPSSAASTTPDAEQLIYDRAHNQLWGVGPTWVGALSSSGSQVFCHANGANLPVVASGGNPVYITTGAVDGAGNLWFTTYGLPSVSSVCQGAACVCVTSVGCVTYFGGLSELDANGNLITPFNAATGVYGICTIFCAVTDVTSMAIDAYGNIWTALDNAGLIKISGLAVPKTYQ
jgi:hypothetical protein